MPTYDYACEAGHIFERRVPIAERNIPVPCEEPGCELDAEAIISHANPAGMLDHGFGRNHDNALKGTYDPNKPATNVMGKGRAWRP